MRTNKLNIMRYLSVASVLLLLVMSVTGCNEEAAPTENSSAPVDVGGHLNKGGGPSANGSAILPEEFLEGFFQNFSFQARKNQDGSITGIIEFTCRIPGSGRAHGTIDCMTIEGNQATMSGVITQTDVEILPEDTPFWFRVVDNGEGNNSPPDEFSDIWILSASIPCTDFREVDMYPIENGNVQVNP